MNAAKAQKRGAHKAVPKQRTAKRATTKRTTTKRAASTRKPAHKAKAKAKTKTKTKPRSKTKDPHGGLTAAGRRMFARKEGSHLKPGVKKAEGAMSPQDMKRKGSWASRFYGRAKLPPLVDAHGKPTRFAKTAAAWGEPVPKTVAAARKIAAKGRHLLARYHAAQN